MGRATIRVKDIGDVFRSTDDDEKAMQMQLARMAVLYEDLHIELDAATAESLPLLERTSLNLRRFYFIRRSLATLAEIAQAVNKLNTLDSFKAARERWPEERRREWDKAVKFFQKHQKYLAEWRNSYGGHFSDKAAAHAIEKVAGAVGSIEVYTRDGTGADVKIKFAYELMGAAMTKDQKPGESVTQLFETAWNFLLDASKHGINACQIIAAEEILPRFGT